ncbi:MAG: domain S-box [Holophagaceae bacterium]|nr:domain S-box [Holophagaceae bacterium]
MDEVVDEFPGPMAQNGSLGLELGFASLLGAQGEGVAYINQANTFLFVNPSAESIFGDPPGGLLGRNLREFLSLDQMEMLSRQDRLPALGGKGAFNIELRRPDGEMRHIFVSASTHFSEDGSIQGSFCIFRDISDWKRAEADLGRLSIAIGQASDSIIIVDTRGEILYANPATRELTGVEIQELVGSHIRCLRSSRHDQFFYLDLWNHVLSGEVWRGRIQNQHVDGAFCEVVSTFSPVRGADGSIRYVVIDSRDVTREAELESQLRHSQRMEAIGVLAGGIAHDFNNILTPILGYAEMALARTTGDGKLSAYLQEILAAGRRAASLVDQILTFSRQGEQVQKPVLMGPIVKETLKLLRAAIPKTIAIHSKLKAGDRSVLADPGQLHQVVMNLCTNAFQSMREHGGTLEVCLDAQVFDEPVTLQGVSLAAGRYLRLQVNDTGCGMDQDTVKKAFLPFFTTKKIGEGTGLGLSIIHGIVLALRGGIEVESELGRGSSFSIYLPEAEGAPQEASLVMGRPVRGRGRILVVDDEPSVGHLMREILSSLGYHASVLDSSSMAFETLALASENYDLVISDMTMPEMTGLELLTRLRLLGVMTPIILMTGFSQELEELAGVEHGPLALLHKPVDIKVLADLLLEILPQGQ